MGSVPRVGHNPISEKVLSNARMHSPADGHSTGARSKPAIGADVSASRHRACRGTKQLQTNLIEGCFMRRPGGQVDGEAGHSG